MLMFKAAEELRSQARSKLDIAADMARAFHAITGIGLFILIFAFALLWVIATASHLALSSLTDR